MHDYKTQRGFIIWEIQVALLFICSTWSSCNEEHIYLPSGFVFLIDQLTQYTLNVNSGVLICLCGLDQLLGGKVA